MNPRVLIACGGTGGHIFPAAALAEKLKQDYPEASILFTGTLNEHMQKLLRGSGYEVYSVRGKGMPHRLNILILPFIAKTSLSIFRALRILLKWRPNLVISMGSFSGGPFVVAARLFGVPVLIHEQNLIPGRANRISSYFSNRIATSFHKTSDFFPKAVRQRIVFTGNPVRKAILDFSKLKENYDGSMQYFGFQPGKFTILVMGGSQGSRAINKIFVEASKELDKDKFQILHLTGMQDSDFVKNSYEKIGISGKVFPFLNEMSRAYSVCDLIICRSGAITIAEITSLGLASILIPYPYGDAHQKENANILKNKGAAFVIQEEDLTKESLLDIIKSLSADKIKLDQMKKNSKDLAMADAAEKLTAEVLGLIK